MQGAPGCTPTFDTTPDHAARWRSGGDQAWSGATPGLWCREGRDVGMARGTDAAREVYNEHGTPPGTHRVHEGEKRWRDTGEHACTSVGPSFTCTAEPSAPWRRERLRLHFSGRTKRHEEEGRGAIDARTGTSSCIPRGPAHRRVREKCVFGRHVRPQELEERRVPTPDPRARDRARAARTTTVFFSIKRMPYARARENSTQSW